MVVKGKSQLFLEPSLQFPSPAAITGQIDPLGYFIKFKDHVYVGDRKYVHLGASAHRESWLFKKKF